MELGNVDYSNCNHANDWEAHIEHDVKFEIPETKEVIQHFPNNSSVFGSSTDAKLNSLQLFGPYLEQLLQDKHSTLYKRTRYFQREAVLATLNKLKKEDVTQNVKPLLICAPPGARNSGMIALLTYVLQPRKALILTPSRILSNQLGETFGHFGDTESFFHTAGIMESLQNSEDFLEPVTIIEGWLNPTVNFNNVVIINAQKLGGKCGTSLSLQYGNKDIMDNLREFFTKFELLLVDEAHHYPATTWKRIVEEFYASRRPFQRKVVLFFSATAERGDGSPILGEEQQDRVAYSIKLSEIEGKEVRKLKFVEKSSLDDPNFCKPSTFTIVEKDISTHLTRQEKTESRFQPQAMIIVRTKIQARTWAEKLNGIRSDAHFAVPIIGDRQSQKLTEEFSKGKYKVAVICNLLKEGYSNSKVTLCIILRNIRSRVLFEQFVGRCSRLHPILPDTGTGGGGGGIDKSEGVVLSYENFGQKKLWDDRLNLAEEDPTDEEEEQESSRPKRQVQGNGEKRNSFPKRVKPSSNN